jgi:intein/homing endonuclease
VRLTRRHASLVKVILDNGEEIKCTPDHQFMLRDGTYEEACNLKLGDSLMPFYSKSDREHSAYHRSLVERNRHWQSSEFEKNRKKALAAKAKTQEGYQSIAITITQKKKCISAKKCMLLVKVQ